MSNLLGFWKAALDIHIKSGVCSLPLQKGTIVAVIQYDEKNQMVLIQLAHGAVRLCGTELLNDFERCV